MEIFVGNLSFDITEKELRDAFEKHGAVASVKMLMNKETGRFRGISFVTMENDEQAQAAITALNGVELLGRAMKVDKTRPREERFSGFGGGFKPRKTFGADRRPRRFEGGGGRDGGFKRSEGGDRRPRRFEGEGGARFERDSY